LEAKTIGKPPIPIVLMIIGAPLSFAPPSEPSSAARVFSARPV
jgi:hypothetical protein